MVNFLKWKWKISFILNLLFCIFLSALYLPPQSASEPLTEMSELLDDSLCLFWPFSCLWLIYSEWWGSASISLVTVYKGLFSRDHKDLQDTISELRIWSKYFLDQCAGPMIMSSLISPGAHACASLRNSVGTRKQLASCSQKFVVIPVVIVGSFFSHFSLIFLEL